MNGWKLFARFHGLELLWCASFVCIMYANTKAAGFTALLAAGFSYALGYGSATVLSNDQVEARRQ
jgi:hypothetical protein